MGHHHHQLTMATSLYYLFCPCATSRHVTSRARRRWQHSLEYFISKLSNRQLNICVVTSINLLANCVCVKTSFWRCTVSSLVTFTNPIERRAFATVCEKFHHRQDKTRQNNNNKCLLLLLLCVIVFLLIQWRIASLQFLDDAKIWTTTTTTLQANYYYSTSRLCVCVCVCGKMVLSLSVLLLLLLLLHQRFSSFSLSLGSRLWLSWSQPREHCATGHKQHWIGSAVPTFVYCSQFQIRGCRCRRRFVPFFTGAVTKP